VLGFEPVTPQIWYSYNYHSANLYIVNALMKKLYRLYGNKNVQGHPKVHGRGVSHGLLAIFNG
jgi:hypothetical protein